MTKLSPPSPIPRTGSPGLIDTPRTQAELIRYLSDGEDIGGLSLEEIRLKNWDEETAIHLFIRRIQNKGLPSLTMERQLTFAITYASIRAHVLSIIANYAPWEKSFRLEYPIRHKLLVLPPCLQRLTGFESAIHTQRQSHHTDRYYLNDLLALAIQDKNAAASYLSNETRLSVDRLQQQIFVAIHYPALLEKWLNDEKSLEKIQALPAEIVLALLEIIEREKIECRHKAVMLEKVEPLQQVVAYLEAPNQSALDLVESVYDLIKNQIIPSFSSIENSYVRNKYIRFWRHICWQHFALQPLIFRDQLPLLKNDLELGIPKADLREKYITFWHAIENNQLTADRVDEFCEACLQYMNTREEEYEEEIKCFACNNPFFFSYLIRKSPKNIQRFDQCNPLDLIKMLVSHSDVLSYFFNSSDYVDLNCVRGGFLFELQKKISCSLDQFFSDAFPQYQKRLMAVNKLIDLAKIDSENLTVVELLNDAQADIFLLPMILEFSHVSLTFAGCFLQVIQQYHIEEAEEWNISLRDVLLTSSEFAKIFSKSTDCVSWLSNHQQIELLSEETDGLNLMFAENRSIRPENLAALRPREGIDRFRKIVPSHSDVLRRVHSISRSDLQSMMPPENPPLGSRLGLSRVSEITKIPANQLDVLLEDLEPTEVYECMLQDRAVALRLVAQKKWLIAHIEKKSIVAVLSQYLPDTEIHQGYLSILLNDVNWMDISRRKETGFEIEYFFSIESLSMIQEEPKRNRAIKKFIYEQLAFVFQQMIKTVLAAVYAFMAKKNELNVFLIQLQTYLLQSPDIKNSDMDSHALLYLCRALISREKFDEMKLILKSSKPFLQVHLIINLLDALFMLEDYHHYNNLFDFMGIQLHLALHELSVDEHNKEILITAIQSIIILKRPFYIEPLLKASTNPVLRNTLKTEIALYLNVIRNNACLEIQYQRLLVQVAMFPGILTAGDYQSYNHSFFNRFLGGRTSPLKAEKSFADLFSKIFSYIMCLHARCANQYWVKDTQPPEYLIVKITGLFRLLMLLEHENWRQKTPPQVSSLIRAIETELEPKGLYAAHRTSRVWTLFAAAKRFVLPDPIARLSI